MTRAAMSYWMGPQACDQRVASLNLDQEDKNVGAESAKGAVVT